MKPEVVERIGDELRAAGIPIDRMAAFVTTLHPMVLGRSFTWNLDQPVLVRDLTHELQASAAFQRSPVAYVANEKVEVRRRILEGTSAFEFDVVTELAAEGFTDYVAMPLCFLSGEVHVISFATRSPIGFTDEDIETLREVLRPLARVADSPPGSTRTT